MDSATTAQSAWAVTPEKLREAVRRIVEAARPRKIILFGSRGRGKAREQSDADLMVVTRLPEQECTTETMRLGALLHSLHMPVDLLVVPEERLEYWRDTPGNVYYEATLDGVVLYEQDA
jgi:uncharacterized protein